MREKFEKKASGVIDAIIVVFFSFLILSMFSGCSKEPMPTLFEDMRRDLAPRGSVSGRIIDEQQNPLLCVQITTDQGYTAISGSDGFFMIEELPQGTHTINIVRYGYLDTLVEVEELGIAEQRPLGEVQLRYGLTRIEGIVLSSAGEPVFGASVALAQHPFHTKTDVNGRFELMRIPPDVSKIIAAHEQKGWGQISLSLEPGEHEEIEILLEAHEGATLKGVVHQEDGSPASGAIVTAVNGAFVDTTDDGTYQLDNVPWDVPLTVSSGSTRLASGILIPQDDPAIEVDLPELEMMKFDSVSIVERRVVASKNDSVDVFADVRLGDGSIANYDSIAVFLWKTGGTDTAAFDTSTSEPFLSLLPLPGKQYGYGVITTGGDTLCCAKINMVEAKSPEPEMQFDDSSFTPVTGSTITGDTVTLSWSAFETYGRQLEYTIYFSDIRTDPPSMYQTGIVDTFLNVVDISEDGMTYRWQVIAHCKNSSIESPTLQFVKRD